MGSVPPLLQEGGYRSLRHSPVDKISAVSPSSCDCTGAYLEIYREYRAYVCLQLIGVLFENRPALHFYNYIFITGHKMYNFWFRIKDTVQFFIANNYDSNSENIAP